MRLLHAVPLAVAAAVITLVCSHSFVDGPSRREGPGDKLIEIDGHNVEMESPDQIKEILGDGTDSVSIRVKRLTDASTRAGIIRTLTVNRGVDHILGAVLCEDDLYRGIHVQKVLNDSVAQQAGLAPGDCIISIHGQDIRKRGCCLYQRRTRPELWRRYALLR